MKVKIYSSTDYEWYLDEARDITEEGEDVHEVAQALCIDDWNNFYYPILRDYFCKNTCVVYGGISRWDETIKGGDVISSFTELMDYLGHSNLDYEIYEEDDHLLLVGLHHDGRNYINIKELTDDGKRWFEDHKDDQYPIDELFNNNDYSTDPRIDWWL